VVLLGPETRVSQCKLSIAGITAMDERCMDKTCPSQCERGERNTSATMWKWEKSLGRHVVLNSGLFFFPLIMLNLKNLLLDARGFIFLLLTIYI
jgi:hypothetical protein